MGTARSGPGESVRHLILGLHVLQVDSKYTWLPLAEVQQGCIRKGLRRASMSEYQCDQDALLDDLLDGSFADRLSKRTLIQIQNGQVLIQSIALSLVNAMKLVSSWFTSRSQRFGEEDHICAGPVTCCPNSLITGDDSRPAGLPLFGVTGASRGMRNRSASVVSTGQLSGDFSLLLSSAAAAAGAQRKRRMSVLDAPLAPLSPSPSPSARVPAFNAMVPLSPVAARYRINACAADAEHSSSGGLTVPVVVPTPHSLAVPVVTQSRAPAPEIDSVATDMPSFQLRLNSVPYTSACDAPTSYCYQFRPCLEIDWTIVDEDDTNSPDDALQDDGENSTAGRRSSVCGLRPASAESLQPLDPRFSRRRQSLCSLVADACVPLTFAPRPQTVRGNP